jgi:hypothetical protein
VTSEVQTEAMEVEEGPVFIESDLKQYELFERVVPAGENMTCHGKNT